MQYKRHVWHVLQRDLLVVHPQNAGFDKRGAYRGEEESDKSRRLSRITFQNPTWDGRDLLSFG